MNFSKRFLPGGIDLSLSKVPPVLGGPAMGLLLVLAFLLPKRETHELFLAFFILPILWLTARYGIRWGLIGAAGIAAVYDVVFLTAEVGPNGSAWDYITHVVVLLGLYGVGAWIFGRYHALELRRLTALDEANTGVIKALAKALDMKDRYTLDHSSATVDHCYRLAKRLGLSAKEIDSLTVAALLHDVGKVGILDSILRKPGRLTPEERGIMQRHPLLSAAILKESPALQAAVPIVLHHHERWDGKGYPHGLAGENIPLGSRVLGVVDAYHAMTSDRPYRRAMEPASAMRELVMGAGKQFDPRAVLCFAQEVAEREQLDIYDLLLPIGPLDQLGQMGQDQRTA